MYTGATYQELQPRAVNPCFHECEIGNTTLNESHNEQGHPPGSNEYHTLMQVGGQEEQNIGTELATTSRGTNNEQYSQLQISAIYNNIT